MYRGYPIEQLAEHSDLSRDRLPDPVRRAADRAAARGVDAATSRTTRCCHENIKKLLEGFRYDAHPMGMFLSTVGALSTFYPDAKKIFDADVAAAADDPADRQGADHRRLRLPPHRSAARTCCRTTS